MRRGLALAAKSELLGVMQYVIASFDGVSSERSIVRKCIIELL